MEATAVLAAFALWDPLAIARPLSWVIVVAFLTAAVFEPHDRRKARSIAVAAWLSFGVFWLVLVPHFVFEQRSIVEGIGSIAAFPLSLYAGYLLWNGRDSLFVLSRALGLMGLIYLPFSYVPLVESNPAHRWLVELVTQHTALLMSMGGVEPTVVDGFSHDGIGIQGKEHPYENTFYFPGDARPITYTIILACTGVGSMAIMAGGILAVSAPVRRKLRALAISLPVIYGLNLVRNAFIAITFGEQRMQWFVGPITSLFGLEDVQLVSYYVADRFLAQVGSVLAMVVILWLVARELPEVLAIVEDAIFVVTGTEYDLSDVFAVQPSSTTPGTN